MRTKVEYFSRRREPYPGWLGRGDYSLRNFFKRRTVFYPGAGGDGRPLDTLATSIQAIAPTAIFSSIKRIPQRIWTT